MPRRRAGWVPKLTHLKKTGRGRVRFPGQPDQYFGSVGDWPADEDRPPEAIRRAYEAACAAWLTMRARGPSAPPEARQSGGWTCHQVAAGYVGSLTGRPGEKPTANALRPVVELYGEMPAAEFGARELAQCRGWFLERGASPRSVNDYAGRIRSAFRWASAPEREGCPPEVVVRMAAVRPLVDEDEVPVDPAPEADVLAAAGAANPVVTAMLLLQLHSGMRPGEIVQMRAGDLDTTGECWLYKPRLYKSRRSAAVRAQGGRRVWLGPKAQAVLAPRLDQCAADARNSGGDDSNVGSRKDLTSRSSDVVFPSRLGRPYSVQGYRKAVVEACQRAGVPVFCPRQVRHTTLTLVEGEFGSIDYAQAVGGHQRPDVTRRYSHAQDRLAKEAAARLG